jgi:hypothetical protein
VFQCGVFLVAAATMVGLSGPAGAASRLPQVICITEWGDHPAGWYRTRPHFCDFHERGKFPVVGANTYSTGRLHWLRWRSTHAEARGFAAIPSYGLAPLKLRLSRPRQDCGHTVFTRAHFNIRQRYGGRTHHLRFSIVPDDCLS